jgi:hypothetical protein
MTVPDPNRLGGLAWARRTRGILTAAERRRLIGAIGVGQAVNIVGRAKLALGGCPTGQRASTCGTSSHLTQGLRVRPRQRARSSSI